MDWSKGSPNVVKVSDSPGSVSLSNMDCTNITLPVVHTAGNFWNPMVSTDNEPRCMVSTSEGLVEKGGGIIQPDGFNKAYAIDTSQAAGHPMIIPVPNQPDALLSYSDPSYPGSDIGVYYDLFSHLHFVADPLNPRFVLSSDPVDESFHYDAGPDVGHSIAFNDPGTLAFSQNGQNLIIEGVYQGFMRINLYGSGFTTFAPSLGLVNGYGLRSAATAVSPSGQFAVIAPSQSTSPDRFQLIDMDSCGLASGPYDASTSTCQTTDLYAAIKRVIPALQVFQKVRFINDYTMLVTASYKNASGQIAQAQYTITAPGHQASLEQYLAVGDSYISGEGAGNYRVGTDTSENKCHQSLLSYPYLIGQKMSSFASVACSGAVIDNITGNGDPNDVDQLKGEITPTKAETSQALPNHIPGVISQLRFIQHDNPNVVTVSIGGNDVGFKNILEECIIPFNDFTSTSQNCYQTYEDRLELVNKINSQFNNLVNTYTDLKTGSPTRRVYVIGYPQIVDPAGDKCDLNVHLSQSDREFASQIIGYLDSVIQQAAESAGVQYVDTQDAFTGHELCDVYSPSTAVNGFTLGKDTGIGPINFVSSGSYHPNPLGQQLLVDAVMHATHNLTDPMPSPDTSIQPPPTDSSLPILQAPKTGRIVYNLLNAGQDYIQVITGGDLLNVSVTAFKEALDPNAVFQAVLYSDPVNVGTVSTDASGELDGSVQIPSGTAPGFHTLNLEGKNIAGDPVDVQEVVYVAASDNDYDGDGIVNSQDSCPYIQNSDVDADGDGIDDACDPAIIAAPADTQLSTRGTTNSTATVQGGLQILQGPALQITDVSDNLGGPVLADGLQGGAASEVLGDATPHQSTAVQKSPQQNSFWQNIISNLWLRVALVVVFSGVLAGVFMRRKLSS